jgi:cell filamentation protein
MAKQSYSYSYGNDKTYCYPNSNVLKNKFNITNADELAELERQITNSLVSEFKDSKSKVLDFGYLKDIHKNLFSSIYSWAGKIRTVDIAKGTLFCRTFAIEAEADRIFSELHNDNFLLSCSDEQMSKRLSYYLSEINALHPFREGNGRTQRLFIKTVANRAGYELDFSGISQNSMIKASSESFVREYDAMDSIIRKSLRKL